MVTMKITAYMNLAHDLVSDGDRPGTLRLNGKGHAAYPLAYPALAMAAEEARPGETTYVVEADIEDSTIFEVLGRVEALGKKYGTFTAGFFWDYADAFEAAAGLGPGGKRGNILVRPEVTEIFDDVASWKSQFSLDTVPMGPWSQDRVNLHTIVDVLRVA